MRLAATVHDGPADAPPLVIAHGLFGASRNWSALAKRLARGRRVVAVDLRGHGDSPRDPVIDYPAMAGDLAETIAAEAGGRADLLGHSMGGKAAMALALAAPERLRRLVVADIAPVAYAHDHDDAIAAMRAVDLAALRRRSDAEPALARRIADPAIRAFLLQNLVIDAGGARWRPDLDAIAANMPALVGFPAAPAGRTWDGPALFLRGARSPYLDAEGEAAARATFPAARIETIAAAGHWLHADRPEAFLAAVEAFLAAP